MKSKLMCVIVLASLLNLAIIVSGIAVAEDAEVVYTADSPLGFAIVNSLGQNGVTGGGNGKSVVVTDIAELRKYAASPEPLTIFIKGTITGYSDVQDTSNKTIIGQGADATLKGQASELTMPTTSSSAT